MAKISWIKLKTEMFDDDKIKLIEAMPEADSILIIWIKLLVLAGKCNANGYIMLTEDVPYTPEMLVTIFNRKPAVVKLALKTLSDFGMITLDENETILIKNWEKHQNVEGMERVKLLTRERVRKHRNRKKIAENGENERDSNATESKGNVTCNVTETESNETDIDLDKEKEIYKEKGTRSINLEDDGFRSKAFSEFWKSYPKQKKEFTAWQEWQTQGIDELPHIQAKISESLKSFRKSRDWKEQNGRFIPFAHNWLRDRRYNEFPEAEDEGISIVEQNQTRMIGDEV